jgi:hypothetical protein
VQISRGILLFLLGLLLLGCGSELPSPRSSPFVGTIHPPTPDGVEIFGEVLATAPGQEAEQVEYAFSHIRHGMDHRLWLSRLLGRNDQGEPAWLIIDTTEPFSMHAGENVMLAGCRHGDRTDIVALVNVDDSMHAEARHAWGVDRRRERFVEIAPTEVDCRKTTRVTCRPGCNSGL